MNTTKKAQLKALLDTLSEEELDALIAGGVQHTMAAAKAAGVTFKTRGRSVARYKATPAKLAALAEVLELDEGELMAMDREQVLDAIEDLLREFIKADDDEPADDAGAMPPSAGGMAAATKTSASWLDDWMEGTPATIAAAKASERVHFNDPDLQQHIAARVAPAWTSEWLRNDSSGVSQKAASGRMTADELLSTGGYGRR